LSSAVKHTLDALNVYYSIKIKERVVMTVCGCLARGARLFSLQI